MAHLSPEVADFRVLLKACIEHDRKAQSTLYQTYSPGIYGVIRRYTSDEHLAKDLLSDAFYKAFAKLHLYRFEGAFEGWLKTITVHTISDYFRKHKRHIDAGRNDPDDLVVQVDETVTGNISFKELLSYIQELPDTQRAVINMFVLEDYSHREIGKLLGITENNSRWHLNSARKKLKEKIESMKH